jgi:hypothetical protein
VATTGGFICAAGVREHDRIGADAQLLAVTVDAPRRHP